MARTSSITPQHVKDAEEAMRLGLTYSLAAAYIGVGERTWYRWLRFGESDHSKLHRRFWQAVKRGEAKGAALSLARIQRAAKGGQWHADAWLLERRHGYRREAPKVSPAERQTTTPADRLQSLRRASQRVGLTEGEE